jgi:pyrroline-5-carboxylate reductase
VTRIAFIGGGTMGEAIIGAALERSLCQPSDLIVAEPVALRRSVFKSQYNIEVSERDEEVVAGADFVVLAVKPQEFPYAARALNGQIPGDAALVSIMAGVLVETIRKGTGHDRVVRVMPNTPGQIGQGMSVWTATPEVSDEQRGVVRDLLSCMGRQIEVSEEKYINMATAVSGSGPGFVFLLIEAMIDGAVHIGIPRPMAREMVLQTVLGSAAFAEKTGRHPAELRDLVTSPAGTTAAGLQAMERAGIRAALVDGIIDAYERAQELGS